MRPRCDQQSGIYLVTDSFGEVGGGARIHGNDHHTAERASEEGGDPFGAVFSPEHAAIALYDGALIQVARDRRPHFHDLAIGERLGPIAAPLAVRALVRMRSKILQKE